jgi:hypothetical protein
MGRPDRTRDVVSRCIRAGRLAPSRTGIDFHLHLPRHTNATELLRGGVRVEVKSATSYAERLNAVVAAGASGGVLLARGDLGAGHGGLTVQGAGMPAPPCRQVGLVQCL